MSLKSSSMNSMRLKAAGTRSRLVKKTGDHFEQPTIGWSVPDLINL